MHSTGFRTSDPRRMRWVKVATEMSPLGDTTNARRVYVRSRDKMAALGYVYTLGKQTSRSPERCTAQNATGARFLEVQIRPRVLVYDWDPLVSCVRVVRSCAQKFGGKNKNKYFELKKLVGRRWGAPNSNYLLVMVSTFVMPFSMDPLSSRMTPGCITQT